MLLAVDAGNTNIVLTLLDWSGGEAGESGTIREHRRSVTDARRTADEGAASLCRLGAPEGLTRADVEAGIVSAVVSRALDGPEVLASKYFGADALVAGPAPTTWYGLDIDEPTTVGLGSAVRTGAAHALHGGDSIGVDVGTATAFGVTDYPACEGDSIAAGVNSPLRAVATARLPRVAVPLGASAIGRDTEVRMAVGICRAMWR